MCNALLRFVYVSPMVLSVLLGISSTVRAQIPAEARLSERLSSEHAEAFILERTMWLKPTAKALSFNRVELPRICAPLRKISWVSLSGVSGEESQIDLQPEPSKWTVHFQGLPAEEAVLRLDFDVRPLTLDQLHPIKASGDGSLLLHAYQAKTQGEKLRFEPQWFKNTVGYWTVPTDYATWKIQVDRPGKYAIAVLQGCGGGHGGSDARLSFSKEGNQVADLEFRVVETGHFQNFHWVSAGEIHLHQGGEYILKVQPVKIAKAALGDIRMIHLIRQAVP